MTYEKNGAELGWLERHDEVKTFAIAFKTLPEDDTGVAHILEHSVLSGSEKYPVKSPFAEMCALRNRNEIDLLQAEALLLYAGLYSRVGDSLSPNPMLTKLAEVYQQVQERNGPDCTLKRFSILSRLAYNYEVNNLSDQAEKEYLEILSSARAYADANDGRGWYRVAKTLLDLGRFHYRTNRFSAAESEFKESFCE